ncbi:MAG: elongation factor P [Elusimicrobia bacterium]|nr:elongation factor P [Elusimicrobiota bacterium]
MTTPVTEVKTDDVVRLEGVLYKAVFMNLHAGAGKSGSMLHAKLRNLDNGHLIERRFNPTDRIEKMAIDRVKMQFLYEEGDNLVFMNQESYEQVSLKRAAIGAARAFLKEESVLPVQLHEGAPIAVEFPEEVELRVASTGEGLRGDATFKEAVLENGLTILVPQFVREGDTIRVTVETQEYRDRIRERTGQEKQVFKQPQKPRAV